MANQLGPSPTAPVWRQLVVGGVKDFLGVVCRRFHEVRTGIVSIDKLFRFGELNAGWTEVVEGALHQEPVLFVVVQQVVPKLLLKNKEIKNNDQVHVQVRWSNGLVFKWWSEICPKNACYIDKNVGIKWFA